MFGIKRDYIGQPKSRASFPLLTFRVSDQQKQGPNIDIFSVVGHSQSDSPSQGCVPVPKLRVSLKFTGQSQIHGSIPNPRFSPEVTV